MTDYDYRFETKRVVFVIDTKSFYASVEAVARGLHPMKVPLVVVSKGPNVGGGGLVLATSPMAKKLYGLKHNVSRLKDLQGLPDLIQVPPRMNHYIDTNLAINKIYRQYVADQDWHPYSIDESLLDMTDTWEFLDQHHKQSPVKFSSMSMPKPAYTLLLASGITLLWQKLR